MKTLFAVLLLITIAATGLMCRIASDFKLKDGGKFSIMHLELPQSNNSVNELMAAFAPGTHEAVLNQLNADYIFMAGCYPGILVLCLMAIRRITNINALQKDLEKKQTGKDWKKLLLALAVLQLFAWGLDVWENAQVESWLQTGEANDNIGFFKTRTYLKFGIGFAGFFTSVFLLLVTINLPEILTKEKFTAANKE